MARKRRTRKAEPTKRPVTPRELKELADAGYVAAKTIALLSAVQRGDRVAGFVGPVADAGGTVAAQTEEDS